MKKFLLKSLVLIIVLSGCELFTASPFPEYFGQIIAEHRYATRIQEDFPNSIRTRYQIFSLEDGDSRYLYFLISPSIDTENLARSNPALYQLSDEGTYQRTIRIPSGGTTLFNLRSQFSLPFLVANSAYTPNHIISGNVVIDPATNTVVRSLNHGLGNGYGVTVEGLTANECNLEGSIMMVPCNGTYLMAGSGDSTTGYFTLNIVGFDPSAPDPPDPPSAPIDPTTSMTSFTPAEPRSINIVPVSEHKEISGSDPVGYVFGGLIQTDTGALLLLEHLPTDTLYLWELTEAQIIEYQQGVEDTADPGTFIDVTTSIRERNAGNDKTISLKDAGSYTYTNQNIIVHRTTGILERYDLSGKLADSIHTERRSGILYAFSVNGEYMYRLDPEVVSLQVMKTWW